jgi:hypothetical protein
VAAAAQVRKFAGLIKRYWFAFLYQFFYYFQFVRVAFPGFPGFFGGDFLFFKLVPGGQKLFHVLFQLGQFRFGYRLVGLEVIIKTVVHRRTNGYFADA